MCTLALPASSDRPTAAGGGQGHSSSDTLRALGASFPRFFSAHLSEGGTLVPWAYHGDALLGHSLAGLAGCFREREGSRKSSSGWILTESQNMCELGRVPIPETRVFCVALTTLKLIVLLPQPPECWITLAHHRAWLVFKVFSERVCSSLWVGIH